MVSTGLACLAATYSLCAAPLVTFWEAHENGRPWSTLPLDELLTSLAAVALSCFGLWLATITIATALEALTGLSSAVVRAVSPSVVRRIVLASCGLAVGGASIWAPASASPLSALDAGHAGHAGHAADRDASAGPLVSADLTGLPLPDRALGDAPPTQKPESFDRATATPDNSLRQVAHHVVTVAAVSQRPATYVVRDGDSLWSVAAGLLPSPRAAEVDQAWRRIHRLNRSAIGPDPDLIIPGTTLRLPRHLGAAHGARSGNPANTHREDAS